MMGILTNEPFAWVLFGLAAVSCLIICFQDLRTRWVHILPLGILGGSGIGHHLLLRPENYWPQVGFNFVFISSILGIVGLYLLLRRKRFIDHSLGMGDVVFFYMAACWLGAEAFLWFFTTGILIVLLLVLGMGLLTAPSSKGSDYPIPLAGGMAAYLLLFYPLIRFTA